MKSLPRRQSLGRSPFHLLSVAVALCACGGKVVVDGAGGAGGSGGATSTVTTGSTSSTSTTTTTTSSSSSSSSSSSGMGGAPPIPPLVEVDYGSIAPGTPTPFEITPGLLGFTAIATTPDAFAAVGFDTLVAPNAKALVTDYGIPGTYSTFYNYGIGVVAEPVSSDAEAMPPMPGTWSLSLGSPEGSNIGAPHLSVWLRQTLDGKFHGGVIDVNLYVVDGVADVGYLQDTVTTAFSGWVGLDVGTVNVLPLDSSYYQVDDGNFFQALEETQGAPGKPALNILCVGYLGGSLEGAAGVTPGAPSMPLIHGTHQSGLFWMVLQDDFFDPIIVQHETGHLAGLMHTSEFDAGIGDALSDTPFCPDVMATGGGCPDYDNLMFPTGGDGSAVLTAQQQQVVAASVLYRGRVEEGGAPAAPLDQLDQGVRGGDTSAGSTRLGHRVRAAVAARSRTNGWSRGLSEQATAELTGVGCPGRGAGYFEILRDLGADDPALLLAIGTDPAAPKLARIRALAAVGRSAPSDEALDVLEAVAASEGTPAQLRLGALDGLASASASRAAALTRALTRADDPFVRAAATRRAKP